ncbi:MAG: cyclic nucleotide-binding protein [Elusimicrobia bacterium RIFCSPLOWO2_12_FULL_59_9]|nr:MAG: cyclic nucleotide-binding protein [Elusimicrobia bacterium RIFCSPLOWO2_12_FULL_59_9]
MTIERRLEAPHKNLAGDVWGGLAAMLVALPQSIAFGVVIYSALGPGSAASGAMAGILGACVLGLVAPVFGGAPRLISAPCAPAAAVLSALAVVLTQQGAANIPLLLALTAALAGTLQIFFGLIGGGRLIKYIPYPVVTGYMSGVALLIFLSQLPVLLGIAKGTALSQGVLSPSMWRWPAWTVGAATMAVMAAAPRMTRAVPAAILGLAAGVLVYFGLGAFHPELLAVSGNPLVIGAVHASGESFFSSLSGLWQSAGSLGRQDLRLILMPCLTLSLLLSMDTLKTCVVMDALTRSRHQSNRELIGQGMANLASALAGALPGAGTMGPTLVNIHSGGRTRLSGILEGVFVLAAFLALGNLIAWIPLSALAGILIMVAYRMFDRHSFQLLRQKSTVFDFIVIASVVVVALTVDLIAAAGTGLFMAILIFIRDQIRGSVVRRKAYGNQTFSKQRRLPEEMAVLEKNGGQTAVFELQGSLFFGTADQLYSELEPELKLRRYVILGMRRVQSVDFTAAHMLEQIGAVLADRQGYLLLSQLPNQLPTGQDLDAYFHQLGLVRSSGNVKIFDGLHQAIEWAEDRILAGENMLRNAQESMLELREIDLLREFDAQTLEAIASCAGERSFKEGQKIFSQGDAGDELFLIRRGRVKIILPGQGLDHHLATFARGDFFGDMAFLDRKVRSADAVALADTDIYALSRGRFDEMSLQRPLLGLKVFARLARALAIRLRRTDSELGALHES